MMRRPTMHYEHKWKNKNTGIIKCMWHNSECSVSSDGPTHWENIQLVCPRKIRRSTSHVWRQHSAQSHGQRSCPPYHPGDNHQIWKTHKQSSRERHTDKSNVQGIGLTRAWLWHHKRNRHCIFVTIEEIKRIPKDRMVTYARIVVDYRPQKEDPNRVRITVKLREIAHRGLLIESFLFKEQST